MKCPECDSNQPDNAATCSQCGLSFEAWRELNPIEASVMGEDMAFPEKPDDPGPEKEPEKEPEPVPAAELEPKKEEKDEEPAEAKAPKEKKSIPLGLILGVLGGLAVVGGLAVLLLKDSSASSKAPVVAEPVPVDPSPTLSIPPTFSPTPTVAAMAPAGKPAPVTQPAAPEPTHAPTPRPQPTETPTATDIPLDDDGADNAQDPAAASEAAPAASQPGDLLESSEAAPSATPTSAESAPAP
ncbi:MAG TPA: hypothetical protein VHE12_07795 [bacterium]|nr:hypothetical protein [bacterium]